MITLKNISFAVLAGFFIVACKNQVNPELKAVETEATSETATLDPNATYAKAEFGIEGMTCAIGCAKTIERKLSNMEGVKSATVDFDKKMAMVEYDEAKVSPINLEETVKKAGDMYAVNNMKVVADFSAETQQ